jgi:membrane fusion protein, heavy metal efflux system
MNKKLLAAVVCAVTASGVALVGAEKEDDHEHLAPKTAEKKHEGHDHEHEGDDDHERDHDPKHEGEDKHEDGHKHEDEHDHDHDHKGEAKHEDKHDHDHGEGHSDEVKLTPEAVRRHDIRVAPVGKRALTASFAAPARIAFNAEAMAHVGSAVAGRAVEIKVRLGDVVKSGAELLVVESPELGEAQSDYLQKRTAVAVASAAVEPARNAAERAKALYEKNQGIALAEVQKREADHTATQGAVQTAQAALEAAEATLRLAGFDEKAVESLVKTKRINPRYVVRAPIAGQVIQRETTLGELVSPDKEALLVIADLSKVWVIADVPETRLGDVSVGSAARVRVTGRPEPLEGKVSYIAPTLDPSTRTAQVRIEVPNANRALRPGMFARADLSAAVGAEAVLAVPEASVQTVEGKPSVFVPVKGEDNTFAARAVKVGPPVGGMVPVQSGLKEGEQVVVSGTFILKADLGKAGAAHEH